MAEDTSLKQKNNFSLDWFMRGILTKFGESFDNLTGRNWRPSSSLATSELIERLKKLLDREVRDLGARGRFVPHNIKLKMQWDKFSADSEKPLESLEKELLIATIDHINDNRYHTFAPLKIEIKQDYFTDGVKLHANFEHFAESGEEDDAHLNVTLPDLGKNEIFTTTAENSPSRNLTAKFYLLGKSKESHLKININQRLSVGRSKENDIAIDDASVSKVHAALSLNANNQLVIADTGSTNGTYINEQRISYGKAVAINNDDKIAFGNVDVIFELDSLSVANDSFNEPTKTESFV